MTKCEECGRESRNGFTINDRWMCVDHVRGMENVAHLTYHQDGSVIHGYSVSRSEFQLLLGNPSVSNIIVLKIKWSSPAPTKWRPLKRSRAYQRSRVKWYEEER